ncbi:unnamed protein product [Nippostrongylus brasiliensis]|uniref:Uncharacterized protein n=1 Tax=Nippostrongylus brasiliensis TaxID=27835 RepID=A0A0N4YDX2_NIPBR|nr:unnamed protein product [Nippostrongylus brasiliensis]
MAAEDHGSFHDEIMDAIKQCKESMIEMCESMKQELHTHGEEALRQCNEFMKERYEEVRNEHQIIEQKLEMLQTVVMDANNRLREVKTAVDELSKVKSSKENEEVKEVQSKKQDEQQDQTRQSEVAEDVLDFSCAELDDRPTQTVQIRISDEQLPECSKKARRMPKTKDNKERQLEKTKHDLRKEISRIEDRLAEIRTMLNSATLPFPSLHQIQSNARGRKLSPMCLLSCQRRTL